MPTISEILANSGRGGRPSGGSGDYFSQARGGGGGAPQNGGGAPQAAENAYANARRMFGGNARQEEPQGSQRQMSGFEQGLVGLNRWGENLTGLTGFDPNGKGVFETIKDDPSQLVKFAASLPFQMVGGVSEAPMQAYEAATGNAIKEGDLDTGLTSDAKLDSSQRAAQGINAAINLGGLGVGGSGRAIGAVGKLMGAEKVFGGMASGMFGRAMNTTAGKVAGQTLFDTAEEAGEEGFQSILDDTRDKNLNEGSLDRAMTNAQWGALGGGMMSVGGQALSKGIDRIRGTDRLADQNAAADSLGSGEASADRFTAHDEDFNKLAMNKGSWMSKPAAERYQETLKLTRRIDGSGMFEHVRGADDLDFDQAGLGVENLRAIYRTNDASAQALADRLGTDKESLGTMLFKPEEVADKDGNQLGYTTSSQALNAHLDSLDHNVTVTVGRNPDTKNGAFKVDVKRFNEGNGIELHPAAFNITGADVDGDNSAVFFAGDQNANGYATEMLMDPEGVSNVDWYYMAIDPRYAKNHSGNIEAAVKDMFKGYTRTDERGRAVWKKHADAIVKALSDGDNDAKSQAFNAMRLEIEDMRSKGEIEQGATPARGRTAVNTVLRRAMHDDKNTAAKVLSRRSRQYREKVADKWEKYGIGQAPKDSDINVLWRNGTLGDSLTPADMFEVVGDLVYTLVEEGNPAFRKYGMIAYHAKRVGAWVDAMSRFSRSFGQQSVFEAVMRASMRMVADGIDPTVNIEGYVHSAILSEALSKARISKNDPLTTADQIERLKEEYLKAHTKYTEIFNKVEREITTEGWIMPITTIPRKSFKTIRDEGFQESFNRTFANVPIDEFMDVSAFASNQRHMMFKDILDRLAEPGPRYTKVYSAIGNEDMQRFVDSAVRAHRAIDDVLASRLISDIDQIRTQGIERRMVNGEFAANDIGAVQQLMGVFNTVVDADLCIEGGLLDPIEAVKTKIGRMLYLGTTDQRLSAMTAFSMHWQFKEALDLLSESDDTSSESYQLSMIGLDSLARVSDLHARIVYELTEKEHPYIRDGKRFSPTLAAIEDLSHGFRDKQSVIKGALKGYRGNVLVDSLKTTESVFDTVGMSTRLRKAEQAVTNYRRALMDASIDTVEEIERMISTDESTAGRFKAFVEDAAAKMDFVVPTEAFATQIYNSLFVGSEMNEKATIDKASRVQRRHVLLSRIGHVPQGGRGHQGHVRDQPASPLQMPGRQGVLDRGRRSYNRAFPPDDARRPHSGLLADLHAGNRAFRTPVPRRPQGLPAARVLDSHGSAYAVRPRRPGHGDARPLGPPFPRVRRLAGGKEQPGLRAQRQARIRGDRRRRQPYLQLAPQPGMVQALRDLPHGRPRRRPCLPQSVQREVRQDTRRELPRLLQGVAPPR